MLPHQPPDKNFTLVFLFSFPPALIINAVCFLHVLQSYRLAGPAAEMCSMHTDCPSPLREPLLPKAPWYPSRDISGQTATQCFAPLVVCLPSPSGTGSSFNWLPLSTLRRFHPPPLTIRVSSCSLQPLLTLELSVPGSGGGNQEAGVWV